MILFINNKLKLKQSEKKEYFFKYNQKIFKNLTYPYVSY